MKAFAYMRCSGMSQISGDTWERQAEAINVYAAAHSFEIVRMFRDEGVSGTLKDRPALGEMMLALEENGVRTVIVERLDRLARDLMVSEFILADFKARGFDLHSTCEGELSGADDPTKTMIRHILSAVAQFDKSMTVLKLKAARDRIKASGRRCEGQRPYAEVMPRLRGRILAFRKDGMSERKIADLLNSQGERSLNGKPFSRCIVANILRKVG